MRRPNVSLAEHLYDAFHEGTVNTIGWEREQDDVRGRWKNLAREAREIIRWENTPPGEWKE